MKNYDALMELEPLMGEIKKQKNEKKLHSPTMAEKTVLATLEDDDREKWQATEDEITALKKEYAKISKACGVEIESLTNQVLDVCRSSYSRDERRSINDTMSLKGYGNVTYSRSIECAVADRESLIELVLSNGWFDVLDFDLKKVAALDRDFFEATGSHLPGVIMAAVDSVKIS